MRRFPSPQSFTHTRTAALCLALFAAASATGPAGAALNDASVWLKPVVYAPASAKGPIQIELQPDEAACRKAYGNDWRSKCTLRLGRAGSVAEGVVMTPAVPGVWRWTSATSLAFEPKDAWRPGQVFKASLLGLPLPLRATMAGSLVTVETPPLTALSAHGQVWIDPRVAGDRWAAFEFSFTTTPERAKVERAFALDFAKESGLKTAQPEFVWSDDGASVYVKVKLLALPAHKLAVTARIPGVAARTEETNGRVSVPKGFETVKVSQFIPGAADLFEVKRADVKAVRDEALNTEYEVEVAASLQMDPAELLKNLRILELPAKMTADAQRDAVWTDAPVIDEEILSRAEPVEAAPAPGTAALSDKVRLRIKARPGAFLHLSLPEGWGPDKTEGLADPWSTVLLLPKTSSAIEFLQPGHMLTLSGSWTLSLYSTGVEKIKWRVARVRDGFLALAADGWDVMNATSPDAYTSSKTGEIELGASTEGKARFSSIDLADAVMEAGPGLWQVELTGTRMKDGKEEVVAAAEKRLLLTNIALIAKTSADGTVDVFAAGFGDEKPAAGLKASLIAENGTVIEAVDTDAAGRAHFKSTKGLERELTPAAVLVRSKGTDLAWISLKDGSNLSPTVRWQTGGRHTAGAGMAAFSFADRGIYRAGETVHFGLGMRELDFSVLPEGLPVEAKLTNDAGKVVETRRLQLSKDGLAQFDWTVPAGTSPGRIKMDVFASGVDAALSTTAVYVADFAPETLSLTAAIPENERRAAWVKPGPLAVSAKLTSLFGAGAEGRRIEGELFVTPLASTTFPGFEGWRFDSPAAGLAAPSGPAKRLTVPAAATTGAGDATLTLPIESLALPGFAEAQLHLTGLEAEGGGAVEKTLAFKLLPADAALGWKLEKTPQPANFLLTGDAAEMAFIALDRMLAPRAGWKLRASVEKTRRVTELSADGSGRLTYTDTPVTEPVRTVELTTDANGRASLPLDTGMPGDWMVKITDEAGALRLCVPYSTAGGTLADAASDALPTAEVRAKLEKSELEAGETAKISLLSPFAGFGLVTFESAGVVSAQWTSVKAGENLIETKVPEGFSGRAWVRLSLVRGQAAAKKFLQGFTETALPVVINTKDKRLGLTVEVPEKLESGRRIPVRLRSDAPAEVFVWAVDEGILSLTNWRRPDPVAALLEDRALEVETRQTLSHLMPDASAVSALTSPFGGDFEAAAKAAAGFGNPFARSLGASAVWWGGLVRTGPDAKTLEAELPEGFNGAVRFIALGASEVLAGSTEAGARIAAPLVISPVLPAAVSPGDRFRAGAVVTPAFPTASGALEIAAPGGFTPQKTEAALAFPTAGGASAALDFTAPAAPMKARFTFRAKAQEQTAEGSSERTAERTAEVGVRPASVWAERIYGGRLENSFTAENAPKLTLPTETYVEDAQTRFTVSTVPAALVAELAAPFADAGRDDKALWLTTPAEAIAAALPLTLIAADPDAARFAPLGEKGLAGVAAAARGRTETAIGAIRQCLAWDGVRHFSWGPADPLLTAWSLDYLLLTARSGGVPTELIAALRERMLENLNTEPQTLDEARTSAYALWVLTREGTMTTEYLEALRASLEERFTDWKRDAAAAFMAAAYEQLRLRAEAASLLTEPISTARAGGAWTPETATALAALALSESGLLANANAKFLFSMTLEDFAQNLKTGEFPAFYAGAAAAALMQPAVGGLAKAEQSEAPQAPELVCTKRAAGFPETQDRAEVSAASAALTAPGCLEVTVSHLADSSYVWWQASQTGWLRPADGKPLAAVRRGIEVERTFLGADGRPKTTFRSGERVTVRVRLRAYAGEEALRDVTVTDLLPGGFVYAMPAGAGPDGAQTFRRGEERLQWLSPELSSWDPMSFTYTVRAALPGDYAVPPVEAASLSRPALYARGASGRITVLAVDESAAAPETPAPQSTIPAAKPAENGKGE